MAENVVKFRIDTKEYDANIKRASQVLSEYFNKVRAGGGTLMKLDDGVMEAVKSIGEFSTKADNARGALRELTQATADMLSQYRAMTDEEKRTPLGAAMLSSIDQLTQRAGVLRDAMDDVNATIKLEASDTKTFDEMAGGAQFATSAFQTLEGASKLLGIELGDNVEVLARLQAAMAVTNGLTQIQAALQKESAFMQGLNAAKTALATAAQQAYAVVTGEATAAQVALNAAMAINPYTWVVVAAGAAIAQTYLFIEAVNKTIDAGEDLSKVITNSMISPLYAYMVACDDVEAKEKRWQESLENTKKIVDELAQSFNILKESMKLSGASDSQLYNAEYDSLQKKRDELSKQLGNKDLPHDEWMKISAQIKEVNKAMSELNQKRKTYLDMVAKLKDKSYVDSLSTEREINAAMGIAKSERGQSQMGSENWNFWNALEENLKKRLPNASTTKPTTTGTTSRITTTHELSPQERAADIVAKAESTYAETLLKNSMRLETGVDSTLDNKRKEMAAQERLFDAYNDAYVAYKDPAYKEASRQAAEKIKRLADEVKTLTDAQEASKQAARQLEEAQKNLADAQQKLADAQATGSATAIYNAQKDVDRQQGVVNRLKNPSLPVPAKPTGFDAMVQTVQAELKFDQMRVDENALHSVLKTAIENGLNMEGIDFSGFQERIAKGLDIPDSAWEALQEQINTRLKEMGIDPIKINFETGNIDKVEDDGKKLSKEWQSAGSAIQAVGSAMSQIEDPAAKVMGTIAQAIATIALTFAESLRRTFGPWDWIAAAAAGTVTMISTISAIHSATGYANGGVIEGNSFSGDNLRMPVLDGGGMIGVNSGEVILNRAQAGVIASQLSGNPLNDINLTASVDGEKIVLAVNRYFRRTNKSEAARWT